MGIVRCEGNVEKQRSPYFRRKFNRAFKRKRVIVITPDNQCRDRNLFNGFEWVSVFGFVRPHLNHTFYKPIKIGLWILSLIGGKKIVLPIFKRYICYYFSHKFRIGQTPRRPNGNDFSQGKPVCRGKPIGYNPAVAKTDNINVL